jgi:hypothetical protein
MAPPMHIEDPRKVETLLRAEAGAFLAPLDEG